MVTELTGSTKFGMDWVVLQDMWYFFYSHVKWIAYRSGFPDLPIFAELLEVQEKISEYPFLDDPAEQVAGAGTEFVFQFNKFPAREKSSDLTWKLSDRIWTFRCILCLQQEERDILMAPV